MSEANSSGDSSELEALFDSIAAPASHPPQVQPSPPPVVEKPPSLMRQAQESDSLAEDSGDLQALFDSTAPTTPASSPSAPPSSPPQGDISADGHPVDQEKIFTQVGQMARQLRNTLALSGYDKLIEQTVEALPDTQDRLTYVANLTEQAASKVLNASDVANPLLAELETGAVALAAKWDALYANKMGVEDFRLLAGETHAFLKSAVPHRTAGVKEQLLEIVMAQDFQDLTGQVIKKIAAFAHGIETQLMSLLIETIPVQKRTEVESLLNGPVINAEGRSDVVVSQQQVDDLLDSLGF